MNTQSTDTYSYRTPFFFGVFSLFLILAVNQVAEFFQIYSGYHWFDNPMHFLGGFAVGLFGIGIIRALYSKEGYEKSPQLLITVLGVLFVGVLWEIIEMYYEVSILYGGDFFADTSKDLLMDTLGGILSYICFHPRKKTKA